MAKHRYPSRHRPGSNWATDRAWEIMDMLVPDAIPDDARNLMAGMIAGSLIRAAINGTAAEEAEWKAKTSVIAK